MFFELPFLLQEDIGNGRATTACFNHCIVYLFLGHLVIYIVLFKCLWRLKFQETFIFLFLFLILINLEISCFEIIWQLIIFFNNLLDAIQR